MTTQQPPRIIGLTGQAATGKDTVRYMLEEDHGFDGLAFADPIRQMIGELLTSNGFDTVWMYDRDHKERPIPGLGASYRELAQRLGDWGRAIHPDFWVNIAANFVSELQQRGDHLIVISDVRFVNEARWIREAGGQIWRLERPGVASVRDHESERQVAQVPADHTIHNTGTMEDLWCQVTALVGEVTA